ncbi:MAG: PQQ-dependent sugar dehydrogenase [Phycisphaerae bacterium]|nr:PQQ-dependent sugar dehydrogenase [Phycisphaerae bacterium]
MKAVEIRALLMSLIFLGACGPVSRGATPLTTEQVAFGLTSPVYVTHAPGDFDRVFIVEQSGRIRILDISQDPPVLQVAPFLDISSRVSFSGERGLLGLAFHPDYASNGYFYVNYTRSAATVGDTVIARFETPVATPNQADAGSESILLVISQPQSNHNGGWLAFGPNDGYLYIATGDGGGAGDDDAGHTALIGNSQDITDNLLGKLLRIDVDGGVPYGIPPDNPFVGITGDDEIWAYGLRNPWRNAFDPITGDLYIADVGQSNWEEIDFDASALTGGLNYGWRCREGMHVYDPTDPGGNCAVSVFREPIYEYSHGGSPFRCSITGGEVYRGCAVTDLWGTYFFADYCSNQIWSFRNGPAVADFMERTAELAPASGSITSIVSFGRDAFGEIYICEQGGEVYKIVPDGVPSQCGLPVPAATEWGVAALTLVLLSAGTLVIRRQGGRLRAS